MPVERKIIILDKLKEIEHSLSIVKEAVPDDVEEFKNMDLLKDEIMNRMEFIIQNIIDICVVLSSDLKLEKPYSEDDIIENLVKAGLLQNDMARKIHEMKGLRNIQVHRNWKIDDELVFESLAGEMADIEVF